MIILTKIIKTYKVLKLYVYGEYWVLKIRHVSFPIILYPCLRKLCDAIIPLSKFRVSIFEITHYSIPLPLTIKMVLLVARQLSLK